MDNENLINKINLLEEELKKTKGQLQKYTNGNNHKTYYEKGKSVIVASTLNDLRSLLDVSCEAANEKRCKTPIFHSTLDPMSFR